MTNTLDPNDDKPTAMTNTLQAADDHDHHDPIGHAAVARPNRHSTLRVDEPELVEPRSIRWTTSPFDRRGIGLIVASYVVVTGIMVAVGLAIVEWWDPSSLGAADADINRSVEDLRTEWLTTVSEHMSMLSDTRTKIVLGVALIPVFVWLFRRWHEAALIFGGLVLEVSIFGTSARIVGRERPPVEQLEESFTSSFPSGHIAAATTFYVGLAVLIWMRTTRTRARAAGVIVGVGGPLAVTWGRIYMGMHYVTDALAGVAIGVVVLAVMYRAVMRTLPPDESPSRHDEIVAAAKGSAAKEAA